MQLSAYLPRPSMLGSPQGWIQNDPFRIAQYRMTAPSSEGRWIWLSLPRERSTFTCGYLSTGT